MADTIRLLLAEDESAQAQPMIESLTAAGHDVTWVRTSRELRAGMEEVRPDLLLLDVSLDINGLEFLQSIRFSEDHPRAGVIALANAVGDRERALQLGAMAALLKPVDGGALCSLVEELLAVL